jgi:UDP-N-acetylenolpyruvoylglucosamine reductase
MNSGCYEDDISKVLLSVQAIDKNNLSEIEIKRKDIKFSYRGTNLPEHLIIISAKLKGSISKKEEIEKNNLAL